MQFILVIILFGVSIALFIYALPLLLLLIGLYLIINIFVEIYYKSKKFLSLKKIISKHAEECNELNEHIEDLKNSYNELYPSKTHGTASYSNTSNFKYKKRFFNKIQSSSQTVDCSLNVCRNAKREPFKYLCKYFGIKEDEETLLYFEKILNDFSAAEQGKQLLKKEETEILESLSNKIPYIIRKFDQKRLLRKLGFKPIDFSQLYFPKYTFNYVSAGGNSANKTEIILDINNLEEFIKYLSSKIKFNKSIKKQRALMTLELREKIKKRDNFTCKICGLSTTQEPNLLLEIDHIIPLSKGGISSEDNLQTLCWKCNRKKGNKILLTHI